MIERKFIGERLKEFQIQEFMAKSLKGAGQSHIKLKRTPLGEKITVYASKPGLVVGRSGESIRNLTRELKSKFHLENPQIEISEVENIYLNAKIVAEIISTTLERFGSSKFKGVGHKSMENVMNAGALGVEILISGKIPGSRAKRWRFYKGYLKKCGDAALVGIRTAYKTANLKTGVIGIQVRIMPPDIELPDKILSKKKEVVEDIKEEKTEKLDDTEETNNNKENEIKEDTKKVNNKKDESKKEIVESSEKKDGNN